MLQQTIRQAPLIAELVAYRPTLGHINYFSITNDQGRLRLNIHHHGGSKAEKSVVEIFDQRFVRFLFRLLMDLIHLNYFSAVVYGEGPVSFVLVDPNQSSVRMYRKKAWDDPRSPLHPHQIWLHGSGNDRAICRKALIAACGYLKPVEFRALYSLHQSAQYHFITRMLWCKPDNSYDHPAEALSEAIKHHKEVTKLK